MVDGKDETVGLRQATEGITLKCTKCSVLYKHSETYEHVCDEGDLPF